jgi:hypothetical protein
MLAIVLPDKNNSYSYYEKDKVFYTFTYQDNTDILFDILRKNMFNKKNYGWGYAKEFMQRYPGDFSYIKSIYWSNFIQNPPLHINEAVERKSHIDEYEITKEV